MNPYEPSQVDDTPPTDWLGRLSIAALAASLIFVGLLAGALAILAANWPPAN